MDNLKAVIASNISALRRAYPLTQAELAEKLCYSDKAVPKWERGESIPDVAILREIAVLFGVSVDYLISDHSNEKERIPPKPLSARNRRIISLLSIALLWLLTTIAFVVVNYYIADFEYTPIIFAGAGLLTLVLALIFNSVWGNLKLNYVIITLLLWGALAAIFFIFSPGFTLLFSIGIPAQIIIILWSMLVVHHNKK